VQQGDEMSVRQQGEGELRCHARLLHRSTTMAFCEGSVFGGDGKLCAHATGTFKYVPRKEPARPLSTD